MLARWVHHINIAVVATPKTPKPMMTAATGGKDLFDDEDVSGCWEGITEVGEGMTPGVVMVEKMASVVLVGATAGSVSVRPMSRYRNNGLEVVKKGDDMLVRES